MKLFIKKEISTSLELFLCKVIIPRLDEREKIVVMQILQTGLPFPDCDIIPLTPGQIFINGNKYYLSVRNWTILEYIIRSGKTSFTEIEEILDEDFEQYVPSSIRKHINSVLKKGKSRFRVSISSQAFDLRLSKENKKK